VPKSAITGLVHWRPQAWAGGTLAPSPRKCCKVFFVLQMLSKVLVYEVCMHYLRKCQLLGSFAPDPHRGSAPAGPRWGTSVFQTPSLPTR